MTGYSWTVVINKIPYGVVCRLPSTAVLRALQQYCKEHPKSSMVLFDIYMVNRTLADKGKVISETFNRHRKQLLADPIDGVQTPLSKAAWIKAPCCFLYLEKGRKHGKRMRAACRIYKFRPEICRTFHCGKHTEDEPLQLLKYNYEMSGKFREHLKQEILKLEGEKGWMETERLIREAEQAERRRQANE